jgi:NAD(P)-dependent dehydrogenase (short-subunit alcohol dehydrogenase family)
VNVKINSDKKKEEIHMTKRVAVITGGASGIGRETSLKFAKKGDRVVVADFNEELGNETVEMIRSAGGDDPFRGRRSDLHQNGRVQP